MRDITISELIGKTITEITNGTDVINITCSDGSEYQMMHSRDCCEYVRVEDVDGDLNDLVGVPILQAEEVTSDAIYNGKPKHPDSFTWTFYKLATINGYVTIRWLAESNGYYSERVDFIKVK